MPPFARREFSGNAVPTTITGGIDADDLTINIVLATGWPTGATGPFIVTLDEGLATEEKVEVATRAGLILTVTPTGRGHDNTAAVSHGPGARIEHTMAARDLSEANAHAADATRDDHTQYLTVGRHTVEQHAIDGSEINDGSVGYTELMAGQRWEPGDFKWGVQAANHTGWLLCNGAAVSQATYAALFAAMGGHIFGADPGGGNFLLPDLRKKMILGKAAAGVGSTLGGSGGSADAVNVAHSHTVNSHSHGGGTGAAGGHAHVATWGGEFIVINGADPGASIDTSGSSYRRTTTTEAVGNHTHAIAGEAPGTNAVGQAATDANLPPFLSLNGFIHV